MTIIVSIWVKPPSKQNQVKLTLTWQFRPSWVTDFFRATSYSASDFRFYGRPEKEAVALKNSVAHNQMGRKLSCQYQINLLLLDESLTQTLINQPDESVQ